MVEKILLIEDHPDMASVFCHVLKERGYAVTLAATVEEARSQTQANAFDLILCDFRVAGGTAIQFMEWLQASGPRPPIFCVSGYGDEAEELCMRAGFDGFVRKPVDLDVLASKMAALGLTPPSPTPSDGR